jgi:hypothetical protein
VCVCELYSLEAGLADSGSFGIQFLLEDEDPLKTPEDPLRPPLRPSEDP